MKIPAIALASVSLFAVCTVAAAGDDKMSGDKMSGDNMKMMMDANKDGMISRDEYMKHQETMWSKMTKNASGMVDAKSMTDMRADHMTSGSMKSGDVKSSDTKPNGMTKPK